jgi:hypothetical protein
LFVIGGGRGRTPATAGEDRHLDVAVALRRIDLAGIDVQLTVAHGLGKLLGQCLALAAALPGPCRVLVAVTADRLGVDGPARQFLQQGFGLAERIVDTGLVGHATGAASEPAVDAQQAIGGELGRMAVLAVTVAAFPRDGAEGGHQLT